MNLRTAGSSTAHSTDTLDRRRRSLAPLVIVTVAALVFTILLILVRLQWAPLESADHGAAADINSLIAGNATLVAVVKAVTWLGSDGVLWTVIGAATVILAIRRRWRLAAYLLVTGAGALVLDPILKSLVGRLRPVVAHPIAHGTGNSFPSGHSLGSIVCYGAILLVFLPAARGRWRPVVHHRDRRAHRPDRDQPDPARRALPLRRRGRLGARRHLARDHGIRVRAGPQRGRPAGDRPGGRGTGTRGPRRSQAGPAGTRRRFRPAAATAASPPGRGGLGADPRHHRRPRRAGHQGRQRQRAGRPDDPALVRRPPHARLDPLEPDLQHARGDPGDPHRRPRHLRGLPRRHPALAAGRLRRRASCSANSAAFLAAAAVVKRPRPDVTQLDQHLPTSAYPSGHEAATCCLYIAIAILVIGHARGWWRWLFLVPAIAMPVLVALSRMYRGEHHPTDLLASLLFSALWLTAASVLIKPSADRQARQTGRRPTQDQAAGGEEESREPPPSASDNVLAAAGRVTRPVRHRRRPFFPNGPGYHAPPFRSRADPGEAGDCLSLRGPERRAPRPDPGRSETLLQQVPTVPPPYRAVPSG